VIGLEALPASVTISGGTAGALVGAQVVQLGFEARLLIDVTRLKTRLNMEDEDE